MTEKKETATKNLMLRLPDDEYVMLKALASHHGNSLNSEVLVAINLAAQSEKGLFIPSKDLSRSASNRMRAAHLPDFLKEHVGYQANSGVFTQPIEDVRKILKDWLLWHGKLRNELFKLGFITEGMDRVLNSLEDNEFYLHSTVDQDKNEITRYLETINGLPALNKSHQDYLQVTEKFKEVMGDLERLNWAFQKSLDRLHKSNEEGRPASNGN